MHDAEVCSQCLGPLSGEPTSSRDLFGVCGRHRCHRACFQVADPCRVCSGSGPSCGDPPGGAGPPSSPAPLCIVCLGGSPEVGLGCQMACKAHRRCLSQLKPKTLAGGFWAPMSTPCVLCDRGSSLVPCIRRAHLTTLGLTREWILEGNLTLPSLLGEGILLADLARVGLTLRDLISLGLTPEHLLGPLFSLDTILSRLPQLHQASEQSKKALSASSSCFFDGTSRLHPLRPRNTCDGGVLLREFGPPAFSLAKIRQVLATRHKLTLTPAILAQFQFDLGDLPHLVQDVGEAMHFASLDSWRAAFPSFAIAKFPGFTPELYSTLAKGCGWPPLPQAQQLSASCPVPQQVFYF